MKITNFVKEKETEKAVLIKAFLEETGKEESFWLPKSKFDESSGEIKDEDFWKEKVQELKKPKEEPQVVVHSKAYEKGEKATKLIIDVEFAGKQIDLFVWIPNSQIIDMNLQGDGEERLFLVTMKQWIWESSFDNAVTHQLEFYNKDEEKYSRKDFKLLSDVG